MDIKQQRTILGSSVVIQSLKLFFFLDLTGTGVYDFLGQVVRHEVVVIVFPGKVYKTTAELMGGDNSVLADFANHPQEITLKIEHFK